MSNSRCNSSSEQSCLVPSKIKHHRHLTALEWHGFFSVVSYIDSDRPELFVQKGHILDVIQPCRDGVTVHSRNRNDNNQRYETVTDDARHHDLVEVESVESLVHVHHVIGLFVKGEQVATSLHDG